MDTIKLTTERVRNDIAGYKQRIERVRQQIDDLEGRMLPRREIPTRRQALKNEVAHVKQLITYAQGLLDLLEGGTWFQF